MKRASAYLFTVMIMTLSLARSEDWPHWRGPGRNGISAEKGWFHAWSNEGPKTLWKTNVGIGFSSVSVADGRVYTMGDLKDVDSVFSFDAKSGKTLWQHSYPCKTNPKFYEGGTSVTPTVDGKNVYTFSREGDVFALDALTGKVLWTKNVAKELKAEIPTWGFAGSPLVQGNLLILNIGEAGTALDKGSGKVVWSSGKDAGGYATVVPAQFNGQKTLLVFGAKAIIAVVPETGKKLWEYPWKTSYDVNAADPIVAGDKVFISAGYDHGCALLQIKKDGPEKIWENKNLRNHINSSVLLDGFLYGFDGNAGGSADFRCVDFNTGAVKWTASKLGAGALSVADGKLIIQTDHGELIIAEATPAAFKPLARAQVLGGKNWTTPVLANGKIYCRNAKGDLVCVE